MATHSGTLAWQIPWTEEPGRLQWTELWIQRTNRWLAEDRGSGRKEIGEGE